MSEATATQTPDTIQVMTWLQKHNPTVMEAWWHGDNADLKRAVMTLAAQLKGIHDQVVWSSTVPPREEYWETGNPDDAYEEGQRMADKGTFDTFHCACRADKED